MLDDDRANIFSQKRKVAQGEVFNSIIFAEDEKASC